MARSNLISSSFNGNDLAMLIFSKKMWKPKSLYMLDMIGLMGQLL